MRRWMILAAILLLALSASAVALAQGTNPTPPAGTVPSPPGGTSQPDDDDDDDDVVEAATPTPGAQETATAVPTEEASEEPTVTVASTLPAVAAETPQAYLTIDVTGGFALDPFFVSVNGGGPVDASTLDPSCSGYITERPRITINWDGVAEFAQLFLYSDHNPSLVVQTPSGDYICNDDTNDLLRDATIEVTDPPPGTYNIWIGNIDNRGLIPVIAVLTSRTEVNTGTFNLGTFVQRPPVLEVLLKASDTHITGGDVQHRLEELLAAATDITPIEADTTITTTQPISGGLPGFLFPTARTSPFAVCTGIIDPDSAYVFTVAEGVDSVNLFAETDVDGSLLIVQPDGLSLCTDDAPDGVNRNPQIILNDPLPGNYAVLVGGIQVQEPTEAQITITTDLDAAPAMLTAENLGGGE